MRKLLVVTGVLLLFVSVQVAANPVPDYEFGLYADAAATVDTVLDNGPGTLAIYLVLTVNFEEADGLRVSVPNPPCFQGTLIDETYMFPFAGAVQTGVWLFFGGCVSGQIHVATLTYSVEGLTGDCCWLVPQPFEDDIDIIVINCSGGFIQVLSPPAFLSINPNNCPSPAPVKESTWGKIKSLYSD